MHDRTRRHESGKMLLDVTKYILTVSLIGTLTNNQMTLKHAVIGIVMIVFTWTLGVLILPQDNNPEKA